MANEVRYMQKAFTYTDTTATLIGQLPANAKILDISVLVSTAFNAGGADYIDVGTSGTANKFADNVNVASTGKASVTLQNVGAVESATNPTSIYGVYVPAATTPSAGAATVTVEYVFNEG